MRENVETMPQSELQAYGKALLTAYAQGGNRMVMGGQMARRDIVAELQAVGAELKARAAR